MKQQERQPNAKGSLFLNIMNKKSYSLDEVESIIQKAFIDCIPRVVAVVLEHLKPDPELDLLSRKEVCNILKVTEPTLHN